MKTKIFCDIADFKTIKKYANLNIVKGITTNPSLMRLAGAKNYKNYSLKILSVTKKKPVSFEVFEDNVKGMIEQGNKIKLWGKNIYVKVPVVNSKGSFTGKAIKSLSDNGIKLNITAVYTYGQVKKIVKVLNKKNKSIISIFAGRMADKGIDPMPIFKKSILYVKRYKNIEILWASTREPYNLLQAQQINCNIITMPPKIIDKVIKFGKSLDDLTLDTVKGFLKDSRKSKFKL
jgi:transaldolase